MKFDLDNFKKSLEDFKGHFLKQLKESGENSEAKIKEIEVKLDGHIKTQEEEAKKRKLSMPGLDEELKKNPFSVAKVIKAQIEGKWNENKDDEWNSSFEKEIVEQLHANVKSNNGQTGENGGFLIPDEVTSEIIELAMAETPVMDMGPTVLNGLRGELPIPKITGRPQMYWVGEEEAATQTQTQYGELVLRPKTAAAQTRISKRLLFQSSGTAEDVTRMELVKAFKLGLDTAFLTGSGTDKVPKGITNFDGLTATSDIEDPNGNRFRIDKAAEMVMNIDVANMLKGNLGFIMRPEVLSYLLRERVLQFSGQPEAEAQPIHGSNIIMTKAQLEATLGYKVRTSTLLTTSTKGSSDSASTVIFGDWSQLIIGMWEGFEIKASDVAGDSTGSAFTQRQVWLNAFQGVDTGIKDETGFTTVDDALTNSAQFS